MTNRATLTNSDSVTSMPDSLDTSMLIGLPGLARIARHS
jgi:hypothetical protein